jgi:hypothetical protein
VRVIEKDWRYFGPFGRVDGRGFGFGTGFVRVGFGGGGFMILVVVQEFGVGGFEF